MARFTLPALIAVALAAGAHAQVTGARTSKGKANVMGKSKGKGKKSCQKQAKGRWGTTAKTAPTAAATASSR
jgi:hypothetical protein